MNPLEVSRRLTQIFWGLLFAFDINIGSFDILPDFIGCILVALGCGGLALFSRQFSAASTLSWLMVVPSLAQFVVMGEALEHLSFAMNLLDLLTTWFLLGGIMRLTEAMGRPDLRTKTSRRRTAFAITVAGGALTWAMALLGVPVDDLLIPILIFAICSLVLYFLVLRLVYVVRREISMPRPSGAPAFPNGEPEQIHPNAAS